jgi:hypothetical protein
MKLVIELMEAVKDSVGTWTVPVGIVLADGNNPVADTEVQLYLNSQPTGTPIETGADGRGTAQVCGLPAGTHWLDGQVVGTATRATRKSVTLKADAPKAVKIVDLIITKNKIVTGWNLTFQPLDEEGKGVKGKVVRVFDGTLPDGYQDTPPTNDNGATSANIAATAKECFNCVVLGTNVTRVVGIYS